MTGIDSPQRVTPINPVYQLHGRAASRKPSALKSLEYWAKVVVRTTFVTAKATFYQSNEDVIV